MSWFTELFTSNPVVSGVTAIATTIDQIVDNNTFNDEEKASMALALETLRQHPDELQVNLNMVEAGHRSIFVAGWRPAVGWVCVASLAMAYVINPLLQYFGMPSVIIPMDHIFELVTGMLGFGALRTFEKLQNKTK